MKIFTSFALFLSSVLFLTVPLCTHAKVDEIQPPDECKTYCRQLPKCDSEGSTIDEVWNCIRKSFKELQENPPVDCVDELYERCCLKCPQLELEQCEFIPTSPACGYCLNLPGCRDGGEDYSFRGEDYGYRGEDSTVDEIWACMVFEFGEDAPQDPPKVVLEGEFSLEEWCSEKCPRPCNDTNTTSVPTASQAPTMTPSVSLQPSGSAMPTPDCVCCECIKTCNINPDPHFTSWDNNYYDFQGGCDMYAAKNEELEIQIATRPRNFYSTITQITVVWKLAPITEYFKISMGGTFGVPTVNTITTDATVSNTGNTWTITHANSASFIRITEASYGLTLQIQGQGTLFSDSVGMCGDWNDGDVRFSNSTLYDTSGGFAGTRATSFELAQDWKIPLASNELDQPTATCDADSTCGPNSAFDCSAVRKLLKEVNPNCDSTCANLSTKDSQLACEQDVALTGDGSWACQKSYQEPLLSYQLFCDYCNKRLESCLEESSLLNEVLECLADNGVAIPYEIESVEDLTNQCCTCKGKISESEICNPPTPAPTTCGEEHHNDRNGNSCNSKLCGQFGGKCLDKKKCNKLVKKNEKYKDYKCFRQLCRNKNCRCLVEKVCPDRDD